MIVDFKLLQGTENLHVFLGCDEASSRSFLEAADEDLFARYEIPKPNGKGTREVWAAKGDRIGDLYKGLARKLDGFIRSQWSAFPHPAAHGYLAGRSTLTNALAHLGAGAVLNGDIRSFFPSIKGDKVVALFQQLGLKEEAARTLARVVVRAGHLPLGLHTSPLLANAVCTNLDGRLALLVPGGRYTRYADDISFSGPALPRRSIVEEELAKDGFELAPDKWRLVRAGRGLYVTGLSLEDRKRPRVPKDMKRRLRQDLYFCQERGLVEHIGRRGYGNLQSGINKIDGLIRYVRGIERDVGLAFEKTWREVLKKEGVGVSYASQGTALGRKILFLMDESVVEGRVGPVMLLALVVVEDVDVVRGSLDGLLKTLGNDPYGATDKTILSRKGLHWNELAPDDRSKLTERVRALPFRSFVAFASLANETKSTYQATYQRLLFKLVQGRLVRYDRCAIDVLVEENSKIDLATVSGTVAGAYGQLANANSRRPEETPSVRQASKGEDPALPLPDVILGILGEYARTRIKASQEAGEKKKRAPGAQAEARFEQVRDKVRAIFDLDSGNVFSRKRPFEPWEAHGDVGR